MELAGPVPELRSGEEDLVPDPFLPEFERLGQEIFLYTPTVLDTNVTPASSAGLSESNHPHLYIVCSWMGARSRNIKKYIKTIQTRFPFSKILLLRQDGGDLFWRPVSQQMKNLEPAVGVVKRLADIRRPDPLRVLVHIFSNGGSYTACQFADAFRSSTGELLPVSAMVLDSTPSLPSTSRSHTAICEYLPKSGSLRALGSAAVWAYLGFGKIVNKVAQKEDITLSLRRRLNDPEGAFTQGKAKRVYIYSQADKLIPAADVELHAQEAMRAIGEERVQLEDFVTSRHVGHVLVDETRYWSIVENLWKDIVTPVREG
ncbi:hypothetical protein A1O1_09276 [Capronia coronata CBS 617.96]|uniref:Indole-diterpene biosynthesis protein PaxU n=1 Tax=Capronia coronata CBS 617.96 TaxID=1182541 RepID=W9Y932_9EURO|nr:uncharacterized protein A1O1_09276 [Capronia coronata CBS 617.96]EXJ78874.1 hypothetical protein A1O1_09276 [Capronia coronata CBS 617.96]